MGATSVFSVDHNVTRQPIYLANHGYPSIGESERLSLAGSLSQQEKDGSRVQMFKLDTARHYHMTLQPRMFLRGCYYA